MPQQKKIRLNKPAVDFVATCAKTTMTEMIRSAIATGKIGDLMVDGTIYGGASPDTGQHMLVRANGSKSPITYLAAQKYVADVNVAGKDGYNDWRLPSKGELNALFNSKSAICGFKDGGSTSSEYWSGTCEDGKVWHQQFYDGYQQASETHSRIRDATVRCIRYL